MKKNFLYFTILSLAALTLTNCKKRFLEDMQPYDKYGEEQVFSNEVLTQYYIDRIYNYFFVNFRSPTQAETEFLRNFEFIFRWDHLSRAPSGLGAPEEQRWTLGLDYWLGPGTALKVAYEWDQLRGQPNTNALFLQAVAGF